MKLARCSLASALAAALLGTANAGLSDCPKDLAFMLTNVLQAGQIQFPYASCEEDSSGVYVAGIARFSTEDGSAWKVISAYHDITGGDDVFSQFDGVLAKNNGGSSSSNLDGFCDAWTSVGTDQKFWSAQGTVFEKDYFNKSQSMADDLGVKLSITQAQIYDTAIAHGAGSSSDQLGGMIKTTNKGITEDISGDSSNSLDINGYTVDEVEWLKRFLVTRAKYKDVHGAKASIDSYTYMINKNETVWGSKVDVLNDKGAEGDVDCNNSYEPYPKPNPNPGSSSSSSQTSSSTKSSHHHSTSSFDPYGDEQGNDDGEGDGEGDNNDGGDGEPTDTEEHCYGYGSNYHCGASTSNLALGAVLFAGLTAFVSF
ncbi:hypothetical protein LPJ70_000387 [Coemansia sp. RSA 2708]|nr:hypothetical protein LPJ70_000387 [Coemansia sp. RSA 2708]KAJ2308493.1 hypothetical protein IWW54_004058 [Coemansia sp. RSA 2705]